MSDPGTTRSDPGTTRSDSGTIQQGSPIRQGASIPEVIDISIPLDEDTPCFPGDTKFERKQVAHSTPEGGYNVSRLSMSAHSGTHVDAPNHFIHGGTTIDGIDPSRWVTHAFVCECTGSRRIGTDDFQAAALRPGCAVIFKANSGDDFNGEPSSARTLAPEAASALIEAGVALIGIDWLSVEADDNPDYPVHRMLLGAGIPLVENLRLRHVESGWYTLVVAPLLIAGGDGAPARAFLLR